MSTRRADDRGQLIVSPNDRGQLIVSRDDCIQLIVSPDDGTDPGQEDSEQETGGYQHSVHTQNVE